MPCAWPVTDDMKNPAALPAGHGQGVLRRRRRGRRAGRRSEAAARDAVEAIDVEYEPLEAVIDLEDALSDRVVIHDDLGTNTSYTWALKVEEHEGAVDEAFAAAAHTVSERYVQQRLIPMAMETRAVVAVPQPFGGDITLYSATQIPHILKMMTAITLGIPEHQVRVVAPAVGGGFGSKLNVYAEELLCMALARKHGVPVRWNETRSENALATIHGRGQIQHIELAADADGKLTAVRVRLLADMGAYLQLVTPGIPLLGAFLYAGVYDLPQAYDFECTSVFTTMTPTDAYRGAGRPEATYAIERAMDALAAKIGIDPLELRRRNFIADGRVPVHGVERARLRLRRPRRRGRRRPPAWSATTSCAPRQADAERRGRDQAPRHRRVVVLRDVRARAVTGARLAELLGRRLGGGHGAGAADGQGAGRHRHARRTARATRRRGR